MAIPDLRSVELRQIEARYALGKSALFLGGGVAAILVNTALYLWAPRYYPMLWVVGALLILVGLRGVDRRVKLRVGPEGLWYAPWGYQPIPWAEFERFTIFKQRSFSFIQLHARYPEQLRSRLPFVARINSQINARFRQPAFYINPTQLDVSAPDLVEALRQYLAAG